MDLESLRRYYGSIVARMNVAALVDLQHMFGRGAIEQPAIRGAAHCWSDPRRGVIVTGSVEVDELELSGHAVLVTGMEQQYIMQFLGGGRIDVLADDEDGADELVELLRQAGSDLEVGETSDQRLSDDE